MSNHPWRLTFTRMPLRPIPTGTPIGRASKNTWHALGDDGKPICKTGPREILERAEYADQRVCKHCHHELSWRDEPEEVEYVDRGYLTPCKVFLRGKNLGYGRRDRGGTHILTHRQAYELEYGAIPTGYVIHHLCEQRDCLEPTHMEAMSRADHIRLHDPGVGTHFAPGTNVNPKARSHA